eukprot:CAMPEP_0118868694 /NCGR_PEP_ID=MMETSP1163-20130328/12172_1 /TAXON_ID=124430 /ORGANISM="Phaeomonas parva, Strain CCMP2877" /LENGTH=60 /DNA_ID=CAMNT_0006803447 /DNA_START=96 /DNA_END=274 /DNA_ORIENTATION=-
MAEEDKIEGAKSAFHFFRQENSASIKATLEADLRANAEAAAAAKARAEAEAAEAEAAAAA